MPLKQSSSKKAFESNLKKEISVGKPKDQSLAIAFQVQRKNKKKAKGGLIRAGSEKPTEDKDEMGQTKMYAEGGPIRAGGTPPTADQGQDHSCTYMCNNNKHYDKDGSLISAEGSNRPTADSHQDMDSPTPGNRNSESFRRGGSSRPSADSGNDEAAPHRTPMKDINLVRAGSTRPNEDEDERGQTKTLAHGGDVEDETDNHHVGTMADAIAKRLAVHMMARGGMIDRDNNATEQDNYEDDLSFDALGKKVYDDEQLDDQPSDSNEIGDEREKDEEDEKDTSIRSRIAKRARK